MNRMRPPLVTLLTDFGTQDVFVGVMKGVIAGICPSAQVIDLTHEVPPQDVATGAFFLAMAYPYFPAGTIHLAVVDPGVGTARRLVAVAAHGQVWVAPDNGLLAGVLAEPAPWEGVELANPAYRLAATSTTFHGRDVMAPAAAHLAAGVPLSALGPAVKEVAAGALARPRPAAGGIAGEVCWVDRFGNLVSNVRGEALPTAWAVTIGSERVRQESCYAAAPRGELVALVNSFGYVEVAVNGGSAAKRLGVGLGAAVLIG